MMAGPKDLPADTRELLRQPRESRVRDGRDPRLLRRCRAQATWRPRVDPSGLRTTVLAGFAVSGPQDDTGEAGVSQPSLRMTSLGLVHQHQASRRIWYKRPRAGTQRRREPPGPPASLRLRVLSDSFSPPTRL